MAQVSSGSFTTNASSNRSLTFSWSVDETSITGNYKKIKWSLVGSGSASGYVMSGDFKVVIDGETVYSSSTRIQLRNGTVVASGTKQLNHDATGNKKFSASVQASIYEYAVDNTGSGTWELPTIPRYATSVQSLNAKTETSITMNWSSDNTVDYIWYSKDNGSNWTGINVTDGKSGSYTISGLSPYTTYKIKTKVRRKDSQLETISSALSVTTYDYPYCNNMPNFVLGDAVTLRFYNPLGRKFKFYVIGNGTQIDTDYECSGESYTGLTSTKTSVPYLYATIPNSKSATYKIRVVYGSSDVTETGGTYSIRGTEVPTVGSLSYADTNTTVTAKTGNNQHIVQNKSSLRVTYTSATANNSSKIASYTFTLNGVTKISYPNGGTVDFGTVNSSQNLTLTMTVTDSRGLTASTTTTVTMLPYSDPTALVTLKRLNNYEDETYLTVEGSMASVNQKNTMTIQYRYKASNGGYGSFVTIGDNEKQTLSLDKGKSFVFNIVVTDAFGGTFDKYYTLEKGAFPFFIDTGLNSIGINKLTTKPNALEIEGRIYGGQNGVLWEGAETMENGKTIGLAELISEQPSGIVLVFSYYNLTNNTTTNYDFCSFFVPKFMATALSSVGHSFTMSRAGFGVVANRYLSIYDNKIVGTTYNTQSGTLNGITFQNNAFVLRYVIGV
jgi:hypothetical protein